MGTNKNFEEMLRKLSPTLRRITHKLNGHFTFFDEDDLFQEALEHLWLAFQNGSLGDKTDSYVLQGCFFHLKNYIRKTSDKVKLVSTNLPIDEEGSTMEEMIVSDKGGVEEQVDSLLLAESIEKSGLSKREEKALSLLLRGMTVREVGKELGISHVMVLKIKGRIRDRLNASKNIRSEGYQN